MRHVGVGGLAEQVAAEQLARVDAAVVEVGDQVAAREARVRAHRDGEPEPACLGAGRLGRKHQDVVVRGERLAQEGVVSAPRRDERRQPVELGEADGGLHVGRLQVVANVRVNVLVVGAVRQRSVLAGEALAAGVLGPRLAPAVTAPVAERLDELLQRRPVRQHRATLTEGDLMGGIERERRQVAERPDLPAVPGRAERVAAVLDQPQTVALAERRDGIEVERIAQRVGHHHRPRAIAHRRLQPLNVDVVLGQGDVDEDGHEPVLQDRVDGGWEAGRDRDHLVARAQPPIAQARGRQRRERQQVGRRAGVDEQRMPVAGDAAELALEGCRLGPGGEPEVEARADEPTTSSSPNTRPAQGTCGADGSNARGDGGHGRTRRPARGSGSCGCPASSGRRIGTSEG